MEGVKEEGRTDWGKGWQAKGRREDRPSLARWPPERAPGKTETRGANLGPAVCPACLSLVFSSTREARG